MNNQTRLLALGLLMVIGAPAVAADIYKRVNEDGVTEFSDVPFPGANQVTVDPNVVATNPVQRRQRPAAESTAGESAPAAQPTTVRETQTTTYNRARTRREARARENRREDRREQRRPRESEVVDQDPGRAIRNAVRNAPRPSPR